MTTHDLFSKRRTPWDRAFLDILSSGLENEEGSDDDVGMMGVGVLKRVDGALQERGMVVVKDGLFHLTEKFWTAFNHARDHVIHNHVRRGYDFVLIPSIIVAAQLLIPVDGVEGPGPAEGNALEVALAGRHIAFRVFQYREPTERRKIARMHLRRIVDR